MPLRLFRSRNVAGANAIQALLVAGMFGMFFLGALYLQRVLGYDALEVGLAFLPATIVMGTLSLGFSERLIMRFGPRRTLMPGVALVGAGLLLFARTPVDGSYVADLLAPMLLIGVGVGTAFPSLMTLAMSGATPSDSGLASGAGQHQHAGRRRDRAGGAGDAGDRAHQRRRSTAAPPTRRRSTPATTSPTWSAPGWSPLALAIAATVLRTPAPMPAPGQQPEGEPAHGEMEPAYSETG